MCDCVSENVKESKSHDHAKRPKGEKANSNLFNKVSTVKNSPRQKIPMVSFSDFPDAHRFDGLSILGNVSNLNQSDPRFLAMEQFAKTALTLFVPFRDAQNDLTVNGMHLPKFQLMFQSGSFQKHEHLLANAQESHDCFNSG